MNYKVKVRIKDSADALSNRVFLWGGKGVKMNCSANIVLTIRVDDNAEPVDFGIVSIDTNGDKETNLGLLEIGEAYSINLKGLKAVWAMPHITELGRDSDIVCLVHRAE